MFASTGRLFFATSCLRRVDYVLFLVNCKCSASCKLKWALKLKYPKINIVSNTIAVRNLWDWIRKRSMPTCHAGDLLPLLCVPVAVSVQTCVHSANDYQRTDAFRTEEPSHSTTNIGSTSRCSSTARTNFLEISSHLLELGVDSHQS